MPKNKSQSGSATLAAIAVIVLILALSGYMRSMGLSIVRYHDILRYHSFAKEEAQNQALFMQKLLVSHELQLSADPEVGGVRDIVEIVSTSFPAHIVPVLPRSLRVHFCWPRHNDSQVMTTFANLDPVVPDGSLNCPSGSRSAEAQIEFLRFHVADQRMLVHMRFVASAGGSSRTVDQRAFLVGVPAPVLPTGPNVCCIPDSAQPESPAGQHWRCDGGIPDLATCSAQSDPLQPSLTSFWLPGDSCATTTNCPPSGPPPGPPCAWRCQATSALFATEAACVATGCAICNQTSNCGTCSPMPPTCFQPDYYVRYNPTDPPGAPEEYRIVGAAFDCDSNPACVTGSKTLCPLASVPNGPFTWFADVAHHCFCGQARCSTTHLVYQNLATCFLHCSDGCLSCSNNTDPICAHGASLSTSINVCAMGNHNLVKFPRMYPLLPSDRGCPFAMPQDKTCMGW